MEVSASVLDYVMLLPPLWEQVPHMEAERRGVWAPSTIKSFRHPET